MIYQEKDEPQISDSLILFCDIPFIWPEARVHAGQAGYDTLPPFEQLLAEADLISGVLVGAAHGTVRWLETLMRQDGKRKVVLVIVVYPACPTRMNHLSSLLQLQTALVGTENELELRLMPVARMITADCEKMQN